MGLADAGPAELVAARPGLADGSLVRGSVTGRSRDSVALGTALRLGVAPLRVAPLGAARRAAMTLRLGTGKGPGQTPGAAAMVQEVPVAVPEAGRRASGEKTGVVAVAVMGASRQASGEKVMGLAPDSRGTGGDKVMGLAPDSLGASERRPGTGAPLRIGTPRRINVPLRIDVRPARPALARLSVLRVNMRAAPVAMNPARDDRFAPVPLSVLAIRGGAVLASASLASDERRALASLGARRRDAMIEP